MMDNSQKEECLKKARRIVYQFLKFRLRSEYELRNKLDQKKLPTRVVQQTIQHFKAIGLIDDSQFAQQWISSRLKKPFGLNRIRLELKQKGIDDEIANNVLDIIACNYNELAVATKLAQHRISKYHDVSPDKVKQRIYGYLMRRGFNAGVIIKVIEQI